MSTYFNATFTATDGTAITSYTPEVGTIGKHTTYSGSAAAEITNNRVRCNTATTVQAYVTGQTPIAADFYAEFVVYKASALAGLNLEIAFSEAAFTNYTWQWSGTSWTLFRWVSGGFTDLATSYTPTWSDGTSKTWRITRTISGSTVIVKLWEDGVERASYTDSSGSRITAINRAGFHWYQTSVGASVGLQIDSMTVADSRVDVAVDDTDLAWAENTVHVNSTRAVCNFPGRILKTKFTGTALHVETDPATLVAATIAANRYPYIQSRIDGGAWSSPTLLTSTAPIVQLATGLSDAEHTLELAYRTVYGVHDQWNTPAQALYIKRFILEEGESTAAPTLGSKNILFYGDSNSVASEVEGVVTGESDITYSNAVKAFPLLAADELGYEYGVNGCGSQGWITAVVSTNKPDLEDAWDEYYSGQSRLSGGEFIVQPDWIVWCEGQNDASDIETAVTNTLTAARTAAPLAKMLIVIPPNQNRRQDLLDVYAALSATDDLLFLCDNTTNLLGSDTYRTNAFHLNEVGQQFMADLIVAAIETADAAPTSFNSLIGSGIGGYLIGV